MVRAVSMPLRGVTVIAGRHRHRCHRLDRKSEHSNQEQEPDDEIFHGDTVYGRAFRGCKAAVRRRDGELRAQSNAAFGERTHGSRKRPAILFVFGGENRERAKPLDVGIRKSRGHFITASFRGNGRQFSVLVPARPRPGESCLGHRSDFFFGGERQQ